MILRVLMLLLSLILIVNLFILAACYVTGKNLYVLYSKQMLIIFSCFVFFVAVVYAALALVALN